MSQSPEEIIAKQNKSINFLNDQVAKLEKIAKIKELTSLEVELLTARAQIDYYTGILWDNLEDPSLVEIIKSCVPQSEAAILQMEVNRLDAIVEKDNTYALEQESMIKSLKSKLARWQAEYYLTVLQEDGRLPLVAGCLSPNESLLFQAEVSRLATKNYTKTEADESIERIKAKLAEPILEPRPPRDDTIESYEIEGIIKDMPSFNQFVSDLVTWAVPEVVDNWSEIAEGKSYAEQKKALVGHREILGRKTKDRINKINNASRLEPAIPARKLLSSVSSKCPGIELGYQGTEVGTLFSLALTKEYFERIEFSTQDAVIEWLKQYRRLS